MTESGAGEAEPVGTSDDVEPVKAQLNKRNTVIGLLVTLVVLVIVFVGIIPKFANYSEAIDSIKTMSTAWLVALIASVILAVFVYVLPYPAAIPPLRYGPAFVIRQTSFTISNAVPAGGAVGLALQYAMLSSYQVPGAAATAGIAITSVWSFFMTLALPICGVLALLTTDQMQSSYVWAGLVGVAAIVATVVVFWLVLRSDFSARKVGEFATRIAHPITRRMKHPPDITASLIHFREGIVGVVSARWTWITVSNVLVVLTQFLILYVSILAVGGESARGFSVFAAFAAFAISRLGGMIPITPGGLGTVDIILTGLLVAFGLPQSTAVAAALVWRASAFLPQVCLGIATGVYWRARQARAGKL
ncbi:MAG: lysylphosphatidylglycerol synthase transmembrane domain-containing protein [Actinomycetes bacterium]